MNKETAPRILVIRMSSLGDIILTAPVLRNLRRRWPGARITMLVKPQFAGAAAKNPFISDILPFKDLPSALKAIKKNRYDLLIDLHSNLRSRLLSAFSGVKLKARYRKDSLARRLFVNFRIPSPALEKHTLERYLEVLDAIGVPAVDRAPVIGDWVLETGAQALNKTPRRVVLLQTAFLGDAVLTLPLLQKIKKVLPGSEVAVLTRPETAQVFASSGLAAGVITDNKKTSGSFFGEFFRLLSELKKGRFDVAIVPHRSLRSALLARLAGIPVRIGFDSSPGSPLFTHKVPFSWLIHDLERNLTLILPLADDTSPSFPALSGRTSALKELGVDGTVFIGANPGSVWPTKRWPRDYWARLVTELARDYGTKVLLVGGKNEMEWNAGIEKAAAPGSVLNLTGRTGMDDLMALIGSLRLFITNDSGPMHIAVAFGVPVAAVFGPTTRELGFFPYGGKNVVLEEELACRPCALHGSRKCPRGHFLCMRMITPDRVLAAAKHILDKTKETT
ncbi:MAG: glycosyltransferase family 9 protein [Elusimicrobiales bacterium]